MSKKREENFTLPYFFWARGRGREEKPLVRDGVFVLICFAVNIWGVFCRKSEFFNRGIHVRESGFCSWQKK